MNCLSWMNSCWLGCMAVLLAPTQLGPSLVFLLSVCLFLPFLRQHSPADEPLRSAVLARATREISTITQRCLAALLLAAEPRPAAVQPHSGLGTIPARQLSSAKAPPGASCFSCPTEPLAVAACALRHRHLAAFLPFSFFLFLSGTPSVAPFFFVRCGATPSPLSCSPLATIPLSVGQPS